MPSIDVKRRRIDAKIVYYGPGRAGKTENLRFLHNHIQANQRGKLMSLPTKADTSLYIDVMSVRVKTIPEFETVIHLCAGPGMALAVNTRRLLLRDTDGLVFVADTSPSRTEANVDCYAELRENLAAHGVQLASVPHVIQYNKCDLENHVPIAQLRTKLNEYGVPEIPASVKAGQGVIETFAAAVRNVSDDLRKRI
jgi:signal recognition particle receptor subunit beta